MSATVNLASNPHAGGATTNATLDTSLTIPTNVAIVFTAGASGSRINSIRVNQLATTSGAGQINLFLFDGTNYHLFDVIAYSAATVSTTSQPGPIEIPYNDCEIATGWSLRATVTTATGQSAFHVMAFGGDF